jgi:hypothetical protein
MEIPGYAAVVGDLVASRRDPQRARLQEKLLAALEATNREVPAIQPLRITIGDEFQALFTTLDAALRATLLVRLLLAGVSDVRFGVGWGALTTFDPATAPLGQDGPAWWAARDALDTTVSLQGGRPPLGLRTVFVEGEPTSAPAPEGLPPPRPLAAGLEDVINAAVTLRDELVSHMDSRNARLMFGFLAGRSQTDMAAEEGVTQAAISQRLRRSAAHAVRRSQQLLEQALS